MGEQGASRWAPDTSHAAPSATSTRSQVHSWRLVGAAATFGTLTKTVIVPSIRASNAATKRPRMPLELIQPGAFHALPEPAKASKRSLLWSAARTTSATMSPRWATLRIGKVPAETTSPLVHTVLYKPNRSW